MRKRILGLDIMRSCAILFVVFSHGFVFLYPHVPRLGYLGHLGTAGVELFFILSGYLIGGILLGYGDRLAHMGNVLQFMIRRWFRTLPNYYLFLGLNLLLLARAEGNIWGIWGLLPRYLTFTQNVYSRQSIFFPESWSLAIEEWFYFVMPLGIFLGLWVFRNFRVAFLVVAMSFLVAPLCLRLLEADQRLLWDAEVRKIVFLRLDALMYGVLAAYLHKGYPALWQRIRYVALGAGVLVFLYAYGSMYQHSLDSSWYAKTFLFNLYSIGFALFLPWASQIGTTGISGLDRFFKLTSLWSYSMYLWNFLLFFVGLGLLGDLYKQSLWWGISMFSAYVAVTYVLSAIVYYGFERPMMNLRERFARQE
jgi:peptidoglycan/LPS O-acetylase OafA/YrhL